MRYLYFQPSDGGRFDPSLDTLASRDFVLVHEGEVGEPAGGALEAAEQLHRLFRGESHPRRREIREMEQGDILALNPLGPNATWLQVGPEGTFRRVDAVSVRILPGKTLWRGSLVDSRRAVFPRT